MRFGQDKLKFMGLVALDEALEATHAKPLQPSFALRTVLAMLFAMSDGDRDVFNEFWRACQERPDPRRTANMEDVKRSNETGCALNGIRSALGWAPTRSLGADISLARRDPGPHQRAYQALHLDATRGEWERQRQGFAEWLLANDCLGGDHDRIDSRGRWFDASAMCNLYTSKRTAAEIADLFRAEVLGGSNAGEEVLPGRPGLVVREIDGKRVLQSMVWGFPFAPKSKATGQRLRPKPVNNIADIGGYLWKFIAAEPEHRCLIPATAFAEAEGEKGSKTRTWFSVVGQPVFAWAGLWKDSAEWGPVYSGLMTGCNEAIRPVHDRMPVILLPEDHERWLHGSIDDVRAFQDRCFPDELIAMERTSEPWVRRAAT